VLGVGTHTLTATFTPTNTVDYQSATQTVQLVINPAPLTIVANSVSRAFGASNPVLTGVVTGAQVGDVLTPSYTTAATASSAPGSYAIVPALSGVSLDNYALTITNGVLTVSKATPPVTLTPNTAVSVVGSPLTLTATVPANAAGTPTGTVTFLDGATSLGTASLNGGGVATLSLSSLATGAHSLSASYSGDNDFAAVSSSATAETVQDFTLTAAASTQVIAANLPSTLQFTLTPVGGSFDSAVNFTVSGVPSGYTASFASAQLTPGANSAQVLLKLTPGSAKTSARLSKLTPLALGWLLLPFFAVMRRARRGWAATMLLLAVALGAAGVTVGCGGSSSLQNYTVTVTGSSGADVHTASVTVSVQP
jgi:hypothetical protein